MRPAPEACGNHKRIDPLAIPPGALVAPPVEFTVVEPANGNGEPVADLPPHRALLGKLDVVGIRRCSAADQTGLRGHELEMFAIALTHRLADDGDGLFAGIDPQWLVATSIRIRVCGCDGLQFLELAQLCREGGFNCFGIGLRELVFQGQRPVRPAGKGLGVFELLKLGDQLAPKRPGGITRQSLWPGTLRSGPFSLGP